MQHSALQRPLAVQKQLSLPCGLLLSAALFLGSFCSLPAPICTNRPYNMFLCPSSILSLSLSPSLSSSLSLCFSNKAWLSTFIYYSHSVCLSALTRRTACQRTYVFVYWTCCSCPCSFNPSRPTWSFLFPHGELPMEGGGGGCFGREI